MIRTRVRSTRFAALLLAALFAAPPMLSAGESRDPRSDYDRDFSRTLPVKAGQRLDIEHSQGAIRIGTHALPEVRIRAKITVSSSDAAGAQKFGEGISITVEDTGSAIFVRTRFPEKKWSFSGSGNISYSVDYDITMPETMPLSARNKFGDVTVVGLKAASTIVGANGQLAFSDGRGRQRLENAFGAITVSRNAGDVEISGSNGAVTTTDVEGALSIKCRFGAVQARRTKGPVTINSSNGAILVEEASGAGDITGSFGRIDVKTVGGNLEVQNSNGEVTVAGVGGNVKARNSFGAVELSGGGE